MLAPWRASLSCTGAATESGRFRHRVCEGLRLVVWLAWDRLFLLHVARCFPVCVWPILKYSKETGIEQVNKASFFLPTHCMSRSFSCQQAPTFSLLVLHWWRRFAFTTCAWIPDRWNNSFLPLHFHSWRSVWWEERESHHGSWTCCSDPEFSWPAIDKDVGRRERSSLFAGFLAERPWLSSLPEAL